MRVTPEWRFLDKTIRVATGCLLWTSPPTADGYGQFWSGVTMVGAHRWAYEHWVGPIPPGYEIDHTCHNKDKNCQAQGADCLHRSCVDPRHLELVDHQTNVLRAVGRARKQYKNHPETPRYRGNGEGRGSVNAVKTRCPKDHEYTEDNTYMNPSGSRQCRQCTRDANARYVAKKKLELDQVN